MSRNMVPCTRPREHGVTYHVAGSIAAEQCQMADAYSSGFHDSIPTPAGSSASWKAGAFLGHTALRNHGETSIHNGKFRSVDQATAAVLTEQMHMGDGSTTYRTYTEYPVIKNPYGPGEAVAWDPDGDPIPLDQLGSDSAREALVERSLQLQERNGVEPAGSVRSVKAETKAGIVRDDGSPDTVIMMLDVNTTPGGTYSEDDVMRRAETSDDVLLRINEGYERRAARFSMGKDEFPGAGAGNATEGITDITHRNRYQKGTYKKAGISVWPDDDGGWNWETQVNPGASSDAGGRAGNEREAWLAAKGQVDSYPKL